MRPILTTLTAAALTTLALAGTARAADVSLFIDHAAPHVRPVYDDGHRGDGFGRRGERWHRGYDDDGVRAWPERRGWHDRGGWRHARGGWGGESCRVIVKRRVSPWGDVSVKRVKICE